MLTTVIQLGLVIGVSTFGSVYLTLAAQPGANASASAIADTLWLIVGALVACAIASTAMVRAQRASIVAIESGTDKDALAGEVA